MERYHPPLRDTRELASAKTPEYSEVDIQALRDSLEGKSIKEMMSQLLDSNNPAVKILKEKGVDIKGFAKALDFINTEVLRKGRFTSSIDQNLNTFDVDKEFKFLVEEAVAREIITGHHFEQARSLEDLHGLLTELLAHALPVDLVSQNFGHSDIRSYAMILEMAKENERKVTDFHIKQLTRNFGLRDRVIALAGADNIVQAA